MNKDMKMENRWNIYLSVLERNQICLDRKGLQLFLYPKSKTTVNTIALNGIPEMTTSAQTLPLWSLLSLMLSSQSQKWKVPTC
jgi:hypothetical protein